MRHAVELFRPQAGIFHTLDRETLALAAGLAVVAVAFARFWRFGLSRCSGASA